MVTRTPVVRVNMMNDAFCVHQSPIPAHPPAVVRRCGVLELGHDRGVVAHVGVIVNRGHVTALVRG